MPVHHITIYHNPACSTSRHVLALIRASGEEPTIVEYLKQPPDRATLEALVAATGLPVRELMRPKEAAFVEHDLVDPKWRDAQLIDFMRQHPILIQRPIVVTPQATRLCRPAETVREILPA